MNINDDISTLKNLFLLNKSIKSGSYSKAAELLDGQQSNISKSISDFEKKFGIKLLTKGPFGVIPTEEGKRFNEIATKIEALLHELNNYSLESHTVSGKIKLWTTDGLASCCLVYFLTDFYNRFPRVNMEIICTNNTPNMSEREADIAIIYHKPKSQDAAIIAEKNIKFGLFASNEYLARFGTPKSLNDLIENHRICDREEFRREWPIWDELMSKAKNIISMTNSSNLLSQLNRQGIGIGIHPLSAGKRDRNLVHIDVGLELEHPYWLISNFEAKNSIKVRALLDYLKESFKNI